MKRFLFFLVFLIAFPSIALLPNRSPVYCSSEYREVDLEYLAAHMADLYGEKVRTTGTVYFLVSIYQYEDFWLGRAIPVVVRFAGLPAPLGNSTVEICGIVEHCQLEGGFFYLNASSWTYSIRSLSEFPSILMVSLFMSATLLAVIFFKKKQVK